MPGDDGAFPAALRARAARPDLAGRVAFAGSLAEPREALARAHLLLANDGDVGAWRVGQHRRASRVHWDTPLDVSDGHEPPGELPVKMCGQPPAEHLVARGRGGMRTASCA